MAVAGHEITSLLRRWGGGENQALDELVPLVYPELRRIARSYMRKENAGHTLQTSALINEAYVRLVDVAAVDWQDRSHFFAVAAQVMRHILVDHARRYRSKKRGSGAIHENIDETTLVRQEKAAEILALDDALHELEKLDPRKARIVELKFYAGLTVEETAEVMQLSSITIKREWRTARAWLHKEVSSALPT